MITLEIPQTPEENTLLARWAEERINATTPGTSFQNYQTMAFFKKGVGVIGAVVFHNYRITDIEVAFAAEPGSNWAQRDLMTMALSYPFSIGCHRITALARKDNKKVRKMLQQLGFKQEGKLRAASEDRTDVFIYGLLPTDYRYGQLTTLKEAA